IGSKLHGFREAILIVSEFFQPQQRIYTVEECERLDASCRGFLLFLEQIQVLNLETREMVIERVLALDTAEFDLEDLKWVILMVLFNIPGCENAYQQMEELLFEVNEGMLH
ncbi:DUF494 family protein, partial [Salmonella enterica]|uniref:DUF494 family protein n=1 Tax=Salmonella enterica TaxID=28901 RepID=UPI001E3698F1